MHTMACWLPQGKPSNVVNISDAMQQGGGGKHLCSRHCEFDAIWGNIYRCKTSFLLHVCDNNCDQRIALDNHRQICRLSKRVFDVQQEGSNRKRGLDRDPVNANDMMCDDDHVAADHQLLSQCSFKRRQMEGSRPLTELQMQQLSQQGAPNGLLGGPMQGFVPPAGLPAAFGSTGFVTAAEWGWN